MNEKLIKRFDLIILTAVILLCISGMFFIYSAFSAGVGFPDELRRQIFYLLLGIAAFTMVSMMDYDNLGRLALVISIVNILILVFVLIAGHSAKGAQRWISLGSLGTFQPSEPAKLVVIIALAKILSSVKKINMSDVVLIFVTVFVPWFLIFLQPDLGTSLVLVFTAFVMFFMKGANVWLLAAITAIGTSVAPFILRDYQKERLFVFLNPEADPAGAAWNITQSKIAVGSGGLFGKGFLLGTQTQLDFVPEHGTDFIFSVIGEEFGFIGCIIILVLYIILMIRCLKIIKVAKDDFGAFLAIGIFSMFTFHIFVNIGMVLGIMPVVGVPLSFISYGGSSLISNFIAIGILESIYSRRERLFFT